jgi:bifunctional non-homologous end joining protein LigD
LIAFDLIALDGEDLRRWPLEDASASWQSWPGLVLNEFFEGDGDILVEHACKLSLSMPATSAARELYRSGLGSPYRSGRQNPTEGASGEARGGEGLGGADQKRGLFHVA